MKSKSSKSPLLDMSLFEKKARQRGFQSIAGIDEAGRGPLAGPVVAAAVILNPESHLPHVNDSKLLTPAQREACHKDILACARAIGIGLVEAPEIDRINILEATFRAMMMAIDDLPTPPDFLLIDGPYKLSLPIQQEGVTGGDRLSLSIAAASIIAKVHRDRMMAEYHQLYPFYDFHKNKGYGTRDHVKALQRHGPCPLHRVSFHGVLHPEEVSVECNGDAI